MRLTPTILAKGLISILLICALGTVGFAHRAATPDLTPELTEFLAAGGALSDICSTESEHDHANPANCEACRISDTVCTPQNLEASGATELTKTRIFAFVAKRLHQRKDLDASRLTRAPPQA